MTQVFLKNKGGGRLECWVETPTRANPFGEVVAEATIIVAGDQLLIDHIITFPYHRRCGYATKIIEKLKTTGKEVKPIGILKRPDALAFWAHHGMTDGLGQEDS